MSEIKDNQTSIRQLHNIVHLNKRIGVIIKLFWKS